MSMENAVLEAIYRSGKVTAPNGAVKDVNSHISQRQGEALYRVVRDLSPSHVIEIGLAMGLSALPILSALQDNGEGRLTSIDPNQTQEWDNVAQANIGKAGLEHRFTLREEPDYMALPSLLADLGRSVGFAFIDGWHTFDYVLLDFFYIDKMLIPGGVVAFDDTGMPATRRVLRFVTSHRHYEEIDVGLPVTYVSSNPVKTAVRRAMKWTTQNRYFRKVDDREPDWTFYARF